MFINKTLRLDNFKTRTVMNAKISVFLIFIEAIVLLLLHNLHDCTFKGKCRKLLTFFLISGHLRNIKELWNYIVS